MPLGIACLLSKEAAAVGTCHSIEVHPVLRPVTRAVDPSRPAFTEPLGEDFLQASAMRYAPLVRTRMGDDPFVRTRMGDEKSATPQGWKFQSTTWST
jgi:hypothetical protein